MKINRKLVQRIILITAAALVVASAVIILSPDAESKVKELFGENYKSILLFLLVVFAIIVTILTTMMNISTTPNEEIEKLRVYLRERYDKRRKNKLAGGVEMFLRLVPTKIGTSPEIARTHRPLSDDGRTHHVEHFFEESGRRLLIVGLPGTGKTYQLLELALALLGPANREHEDYRKKSANIPVILNLATWRKKFDTFEEWLIRILPLEIGASRASGEQILRNKNLILLLDGLDEVSESDRDSCLAAIKQYDRSENLHFAITTRRDEYLNMKEDAFVRLQVEVQLLLPQQIERNLSVWELQKQSAGILKNALQTDLLLREAIANPFYLNTAQLLFATGRKYSDFGFTATHAAGRQRELVERFVEDALGRKVKREYPKEKARKWLGFLAGKMEEEGKVKLELADIQPWWINKRLSYGLIVSTGFGLLFGGIVGLVCWWLTKDYHFSEIMGLLLFTIGFLSRMPSALFGKEENTTVENQVWNWKKFIQLIARGFFLILMFGTSLELAFFTLFKFFSDFEIPYRVGGGFMAALYLSLIVVIGLGLIGGLWFSQENYLQINSPYTRFFRSTFFFNPSLFNHFALRVNLSVKNLLPFRLVTFLNEMSLRHLLEFDGDPETGRGGGSWRWRHRIIQEYFLEAPASAPASQVSAGEKATAGKSEK